MMSVVWGALLVVLATACWSTSGTFIAFIVRDSGVTPWGLAFWRDLATALCFVVGLALLRPGLLRVQKRDLPWMAVMGGVGVGLMHVMWNTSVVMNGAAVSTAIQCNAPIFVTAAAWWLWREPVTSRKLIAIVLSVIGTVLIARLDRLGEASITLVGLLLSLGAAIAYSVLSLVMKKLVGNYHSATTVLYTFGFATLALIPFQVDGGALPATITPQALAWFCGLVLLTTILGFMSFSYGLRRLPVSVAAIIATTEVPFAAFISYWTLGERLDRWQILGAACVVGGVFLLSWSHTRRAVPVPKSQPCSSVSPTG
jgi:drug/metabolite transporter (DMT)-like permease